MSERIAPYLRPLAFAMSGLTRRLLAYMQAGVDRDLEAALITTCVLHASLQKFMAACAPGDPRLGLPTVPEGLLGAVSRRMIAEKTNLPRETVRRKVATLVERGVLLSRDDGAVSIAQRMSDPAIREMLRTVHEDIVAFATLAVGHMPDARDPGAAAVSVSPRPSRNGDAAARGRGEEIDAALYPIAFGLSELAFDIMFFTREMFGEDLDNTLIMIVVNDATMRPFIGEVASNLEMACTAVLPEEIRGSISRRSIADETGIARETVRRKVAKLIESDLLRADRDDAVRTAPVLGDPVIQKGIEGIFAAVRKYVDHARAHAIA